jgi:hypothetical protein
MFWPKQNILIEVGFEVLTEVTMMDTIFSDVTAYSPVLFHQHLI